MNPIIYNEYKLSNLEYITYGFLFLTISAVLSCLFYDSFIPVIFSVPCMPFYFRFVSRYLCIRRRQLLVLQFRDMLYSISTSLNSGYSIENALRESYQEMLLLYGSNACISRELKLMSGKLAVQIPVELIFLDFASRSGCEDILMFSQVLSITKRNGGDLIAIIRTSSETIGLKIDVQREISVSIAQKKFEQNIMVIMPIAIMSYIRLSSKGFFTPVYHNAAGIFLMTICLTLYLFAIILGFKLTSVKTN